MFFVCSFANKYWSCLNQCEHWNQIVADTRLGRGVAGCYSEGSSFFALRYHVDITLAYAWEYYSEEGTVWNLSKQCGKVGRGDGPGETWYQRLIVNRTRPPLPSTSLLTGGFPSTPFERRAKITERKAHNIIETVNSVCAEFLVRFHPCVSTAGLGGSTSGSRSSSRKSLSSAALHSVSSSPVSTRLQFAGKRKTSSKRPMRQQSEFCTKGAGTYH